VILSAQATDGGGVNQGHRQALPASPNTPEAIYALVSRVLSEYIQDIGLYNSKARKCIENLRMLVELHGSQVPDNREALEAATRRRPAKTPTWFSIPAFGTAPPLAVIRTYSRE